MSTETLPIDYAVRPAERVEARPRRTFAMVASSGSNNFDFIRFAMACVVIHTHSYAMLGEMNQGLVARATRLDVGGAWLAVDVFFIVSGYLISSSWQYSQSLGHFLAKRALRIYPGFIAALVFCVFVVGPLGGARLPGYFLDARTYRFFLPILWTPMFGLPGVFETVPWSGVVNGSLWTIRFEVFCYLLPPLLWAAGIGRGRWWLLALLAALLVAQACEIRQWPGRWDMVFPWVGDIWELPRFLSYFVAGMTFYAWRDRIPCDRRMAVLALLACGFALVGRVSDVVLPIALPYVIFAAAFDRRIPLQKFGRYGDFSYGLYLYAFPVQQLVVLHLSSIRAPVMLTVVSFVVTLALATVSWHLVERPVLRWKRALQPPRAAGPSAMAARAAACPEASGSPA